MTYRKFLLLACIIVGLHWVHGAYAGESGLVSSYDIIGASTEIDGFKVVPAPDVPGKKHEGDLAVSQFFEIIRPDMEAMTIRRLHSSCSCMKITMEKKKFAAGERALLEVHTTRPTSPDGVTYVGFVQVGKPLDDALQFYVKLKSE